MLALDHHLKSLLLSLPQKIVAPWRSLPFILRKHSPRLRRHYSETNQDKDLGHRQTVFPPEIALQLHEKNLRLALFYAWVLDQLESGPIDTSPNALTALDIGSKHFAYAPALAAFLFKKAPTPRVIHLDALEIDPYPFYGNGFRRGDAATYAAQLSESWLRLQGPDSRITYWEGNWLEPSESWQSWSRVQPSSRPRTPRPSQHWNIIFNFFPLLFEDLHFHYGLPPEAYDPQRWYHKILESSDQVIFFHQGERELERSLEILKSSGQGELSKVQRFQDNPWMTRQYPLYAFSYRTH